MAGTDSSHTGCQMPVVRSYQMTCGWSQPILFAARLTEVVGVILDTHNDLEIPRPFGYRGRERGVTAFVVDEVVAVHPDVGPIVDGTEVQHQRATGLVPRGRDLTAVTERRYHSTRW